MLDPATCLDIVISEVDAIARAADGNLGAPVTHCPGFDVAELLEHTGGFCRIVGGRVARDEEWKPASGTWQEAPADEVAGDPLGWHRRWGAQLIDALRDADPTESITTWAGHRTRYFWFRRAAQELTVHRWDAEHAAGSPGPITETVALDGLDEFLGEFSNRVARVLQGSGETYQFVADGSGVAFTVTANEDRLELNSHREPDVVARAGADVLLRFVWGRARPDDLDVSGDRALLDRWHELVRL